MSFKWLNIYEGNSGETAYAITVNFQLKMYEKLVEKYNSSLEIGNTSLNQTTSSRACSTVLRPCAFKMKLLSPAELKSTCSSQPHLYVLEFCTHSIVWSLLTTNHQNVESVSCILSSVLCQSASSSNGCLT